MNFRTKLFFIMFVSAAVAGISSGLAGSPTPQSIEEKAIQALSVRFPETQIEITLPKFSETLKTISADDEFVLESENGKGQAVFGVRSHKDASTFQIAIPFKAMREIPIAKRRVRPGERLSSELFDRKNIDLATGSAYPYRGLMLETTANLNALEARQTILEGQFPLLNSVQKIPEVRRGELVSVHLLSGSLVITSQAVVQEPGNTGDLVHVMTTRTKKDLVGKLNSNGSVEVRL